MPKLFTLTQRLSACASLVREGASLIDIGTDHGYLPIWLLKSGKISKAIAADIGEGPLLSAKTNAKIWSFLKRTNKYDFWHQKDQ